MPQTFPLSMNQGIIGIKLETPRHSGKARGTKK